jgi:1,4-dihydroxy-2-naphthoyl-CoA hydrolase
MLDVIEKGFNAVLGLELVSAEKDRVVARLIADERHLTGGGRIHGGVLMAVADAVAAHGTIGNLPAGTSTTTIESKTNFVRAGRPGPLIAESVPVHIGRKTMVWTTTIRDDGDRVLAIVTQTQLVLQDDPDTLEASPAVSTVSHPPEQRETDSEDHPLSTAEKRRAQILQAASRVISKKGFASASIREIAAAAGMPVPTMYQYMKSKDDILAAIFDDYLGSIEASMQLSMLGTKNATDKLKSAVEANVDEFDRHQTQIRMMNRETAALRPDVRARVKQHMLGYIDLFRQVIQDGIKSGEFRSVDPDLVANLIAMLCEVWPLRNWSVGGRGVAGVRDGIVDLVLHGVARPVELSA